MHPLHASTQVHFTECPGLSSARITESQFYNDPNVIDEPELFHDELLRLTPPLAVSTSNIEDYDKQNPHDIKSLLKREMHHSQKDNKSNYTAFATHQESRCDYVVNLPPEIPDVKQPDLQPSAAQDEEQDVSFVEVIPPAVSPSSGDVQHKASESVTDSASPLHPVTRVHCSKYKLGCNPAPGFYREYLMPQLTKKTSAAKVHDENNCSSKLPLAVVCTTS